ncbi:MAG: EF-hand domain-containing protein [Bdellovibrionales bacterium]|nr:EF-hand domain-containing protein [Bdellovibrionales bacterium]
MKTKTQVLIFSLLLIFMTGESFAQATAKKSSDGENPTPTQVNVNPDPSMVPSNGPPGRGRGRRKMRGGMVMRPQFQDVDKNKDGKISSQELGEFRAARMNERAKEGRRMQNAGKALSFEELDLNKDGSLSPNEFPPAPRKVR